MEHTLEGLQKAFDDWDHWPHADQQEICRDALTALAASEARADKLEYMLKHEQAGRVEQGITQEQRIAALEQHLMLADADRHSAHARVAELEQALVAERERCASAVEDYNAPDGFEMADSCCHRTHDMVIEGCAAAIRALPALPAPRVNK